MPPGTAAHASKGTLNPAGTAHEINHQFAPRFYFSNPPARPLSHEPLSTHRQLELLRDLQRVANQRHASEQEIAQRYRDGHAAADRQFQTAQQEAKATYEHTRRASEQEHQATTSKLTRQYETTRDATDQEFRKAQQQVASTYASRTQQAKETRQQSAWQTLAVFDAAKNNPREQFEAYTQLLTARRAEIDQSRTDAELVIRNRRLWSKPLEQLATQGASQPTTAQATPEDMEACQRDLDHSTAATHQAFQAIYGNRSSKFVDGIWPIVMVAGPLLVTLVPLGLVVGWESLITWVGALLGGGAGGILYVLLRRRASTWSQEAYASLLKHYTTALRDLQRCGAAAREQSRRRAQELIETRDNELAAAEQEFRRVTEEVETWKRENESRIAETFPARLEKLRHEFEASIAAGNQKLEASLAAALEKRQAQLTAASEQHQMTLTQLAAERNRDYESMREAWEEGFRQITDSLGEMQSQCARHFPDWNIEDYQKWDKPQRVVAAIQFGTAALDLQKVKHALSDDPNLQPPLKQLAIPTLMTLREQPSLVVTAEGEGRTRGVELLQTMMVRFMTAMPPGKVRFTICDPVGLGESFSSFMHLADYDEGLIHGRIWSEGRDIDAQLTRLTSHMETILQKYLRNEYETIHEYNEQAGEVAEPFQVLSIANFPHGFNDASARRLVSLITGGPRCGIYVLLSVDKKQRMPSEFSLDEVLGHTVHLDWQEEQKRFAWQYPAFQHLPLELAPPLRDEVLVRLLKQAGALAKESIRVEVPFSVVEPTPEERWTQKCDQELAIPIGRTGANRLQHVRLGKGTSQHLLVAGKTGSGKSTLLHALVTSGALHFSPEELEFYLVDFKKGVEFKSYATHELPHARVIAVESEREFGLSVLQRLDEELQARGERFREAGVQSLADYRAARPDAPAPRTLLVIDEFQELFVEDDRLAQEASLLLDRLVRQGRAFGMHVLLGSQTLSGAYSLARSTLGQIAVRVALQCSEADAHLILSDERNTAARFLSRPGEAIYNDQNGLVTANQPFQVVWLPDRERAAKLAEVGKLRDERGMAKRPAIVFEGNAPADPQENEPLVAVLSACGEESSARGKVGQTAWLGSAVAIKPPTSVTFGRHAGNNLLMVGQQEQTAMGIMATACISLAGANQKAPPSGLPTLHILDGTRPGEGSEGVWEKVVGALGGGARLVPHRNVASAIGGLATELARRDSENDQDAPPLYLVVFNGGRFRDLRKGEDDFSFSIDRDKPPAVDKQFAEILKNGPPLGIHTLVWCDGYNSVTRMFDRLALREFELRVVMQMSAADSSNLIDSPAATQLSPHRALLYSEETGVAEKFRPYGMPTDQWLAVVKASLST